MKKVRYVIGAVGIAPALGIAPAMGLLTPTASAVAATRQAPAKAGKTVSLETWNTGAPVTPLITCASTHHKTTKAGIFSGRLDYSGSCMHRTFGSLNKDQTGLEMRTRMYSHRNGTRIFQGFVHGTTSPIFTFTQFVDNGINKKGHQACEALVSSAHLAVKYGPVCQSV